MRDDILNETPNVKEALRRLPRDVYDARQFRISRALNLSNKKDILPKDEWQKYEEVRSRRLDDEARGDNFNFDLS